MNYEPNTDQFYQPAIIIKSLNTEQLSQVVPIFKKYLIWSTYVYFISGIREAEKKLFS